MNIFIHEIEAARALAKYRDKKARLLITIDHNPLIILSTRGDILALTSADSDVAVTVICHDKSFKPKIIWARDEPLETDVPEVSDLKSQISNSEVPHG